MEDSLARLEEPTGRGLLCNKDNTARYECGTDNTEEQHGNTGYCDPELVEFPARPPGLQVPHQRRGNKICCRCSRTVGRLPYLKQHMKVHTGRIWLIRRLLRIGFFEISQGLPRPEFKCEYCGKKSLASSQLEVHLRAHTGGARDGEDIQVRVF